MKPKKGKWGYLQGTCNRCGETELPLIRWKGEVVCDTCADRLKIVKESVLKNKQTEADREFLDRVINV